LKFEEVHVIQTSYNLIEEEEIQYNQPKATTSVGFEDLRNMP
jgi:hypothetical protein